MILAGFVLVASMPSAASAAPDAKGIPILVYHRFDKTKAGATTITVATFKSQLDWLTAHHYRVIPLRSVVENLQGRESVGDSAVVAITADDGHRSIYTEMFPIILQYKIPVTLFIYPSAISHASYALTWKELEEMKQSGWVDVQSHTYWHPNFRKAKARLSQSEYKDFVAFQLLRSREVIANRLGGKVDLLAWPFGISDPYLEAEALHSGYGAAFNYSGGLAQVGCNLFAIPRIPISEQDHGARFASLLERQRSNPMKVNP
ncbi:MAG: polysaccharide deacetylase family protein [Acidobacteriaceae bacterium]